MPSQNSLKEILKSKGETLAALNKKEGAKLFEAITALIADVAIFFNVGKQMNPLQVAETAKLIKSEFYWLKIADLKLCFANAKKGIYGQVFDRIDGQVICLWISKYCEERVQVAEQLSLEAHKAFEERKEERYLIKTGNNYVRSCGDDFEEVKEKELATKYTFGVAIKLKEWIVKEYYHTKPNEVSIVDAFKQGLFDYLEHNKPELLPQGERFKRATNEYYEMKEKIMSDESLDTLQKENAIRQLAGLEPLTLEEYNQQQIIYCNL